jgi:hypothetical protein
MEVGDPIIERKGKKSKIPLILEIVVIIVFLVYFIVK